MRVILALLVGATLLSYSNALNSTSCLQLLQNGTLSRNYSVKEMDIHGNPWNSSQPPPVAISYHDCVDHCPGGKGQESFKWTTFSRQFSQWLLPWLALLSQIPYGAELRTENIMCVILTLGSPILAGYSLILTSLNGYYVASRFSHSAFPNAREAVRILSGLQQAPLRITHESGVLASLVVLPQNDKWWMDMTTLMRPEHTWSISAFANLSWVLLAYILTVVDSFTTIGEEIGSNGEGVGALWLWLLAIVIGWLLIAPKCDASRLRSALAEANKSLAYVATDEGVVSQVSALRAMSLAMRDSTPLREEISSPPIFNYSRFFSWNICVDQVAQAFHQASKCAENKTPVDSDNNVWVPNEDPRLKIHLDNRRGTKQQIIKYCSPQLHASTVEARSRWGPDVIRRMVVASVLALMLQWCTSGAAIMVVWFTPRIGLGCRSGAYLLYAIGSTLVWMLLVASSVLSHYSITPSSGYKFNETIPLASISHSHYSALPIATSERSSTSAQRMAGYLAITLNILGKLVAVVNSIWIMCACIFQFANVFNTCFCNASVYGRGTDSFVVLTLVGMAPDMERNVMYAWIGAVTMALVSVGLFVSFIWTYRKHPESAA